MKVVVTGGNGQIGRHAVAALEPDHEVTVIDKVEDGPHQPLGAIDLLDLERVRSALEGQDAIIHLGGLDAAVHATPEQFFHTNTMATWNVMHAGYEAGVRIFSLCSTVGVYGLSGRLRLPDQIPVDESQRLRGHDPYKLSKRVTEEIGRAFAQRGGISVSLLRPCHLAFDHVVGPMVLCSQDVPESQAGGLVDPLPEYRWMVAPEDVGSCFRRVIEVAPPGLEIFNVAADDSFSATPTRERVAEICGQPIAERDAERFDANPFASAFDNTKAKRMLGWQPQYNWEQLRARGEAQLRQQPGA